MRQIVKIVEFVNKELRISAHCTMSDKKTYLINLSCSNDICRFIYAACLDQGEFGLDPKFSENEIQLIEIYITTHLSRSNDTAAL
jgi:hypothetical protein